jgi:hypothetical protein
VSWEAFDKLRGFKELIEKAPPPTTIIASDKVPYGYWRQWMTDGSLRVWMPRRVFDAMPRLSSNERGSGVPWGIPVVVE